MIGHCLKQHFVDMQSFFAWHGFCYFSLGSLLHTHIYIYTVYTLPVAISFTTNCSCASILAHVSARKIASEACKAQSYCSYPLSFSCKEPLGLFGQWCWQRSPHQTLTEARYLIRLQRDRAQVSTPHDMFFAWNMSRSEHRWLLSQLRKHITARWWQMPWRWALDAEVSDWHRHRRIIIVLLLLMMLFIYIYI